MKRFGIRVIGVFLGAMIAGCDSGIQPGSPSEIPKTTQTNEFKEAMQTKEKNFAKKKQMGKKGADPSTKAPGE